MFRDHPDPLATGSAVRIEHTCSVCGQVRQVRYQRPVYGKQPDSLCLHCIHYGEASRALGVVAAAMDGSDILDMPTVFSDDVDVPDDVPRHVVEEITGAGPRGFIGWQQELWLYHCGGVQPFSDPPATAASYRIRTPST